MNRLKILDETEDTITVSRDDWLQVLAVLDDAEDRAAIAARRDRERHLGPDAARRDYLTAGEARRLLDGENPVKVWREKRGFSQRALAAAAGIGSSYLAEIETGRKPGSDGAYRKLGSVLQVAPADLDDRRARRRQPDYGPVWLRWNPASLSIALGRRGAAPETKRFERLDEALESARKLRSQSPWITDENHWPIYTAEELFKEIEE